MGTENLQIIGMNNKYLRSSDRSLWYDTVFELCCKRNLLIAKYHFLFENLGVNLKFNALICENDFIAWLYFWGQYNINI